MKKIINFFTNRFVISLIGLIAISVIIWFVGPLIKFGENNSAPLGGEIARLVAIIIVLILWGLNNLRIQLKNKRHNDNLVEDLEQNQEAMVDSSADQSAEEMNQISQRFSDALNTLSKLKFKGKSRSKALYELPWYIIVGPPGAGKTTALVNSSLDFPLAEQFGKGALQGIGGTRNCDWWFTNEAVLIDTAGRYTTQDSHKVVDSKAWEGFLNLLRKNRRRRPINGAIVAISIQDLLLQTESERVLYAKTIRSRIDELMEKLEIRFPVYLMLTKSDLVSGFSEYFEDLSKEEREQVWGISLPDAPGPSDSPDFGFFEAEFQNLLDRLYSRELSRIHHERDVRRRARIQGFPQQIENLKSIISHFVNQTFIKNRFQFQPYLRGIYFTSGTQDGTPIDRMMTAVSSSFGFGTEVAQMAQGQGKSFFLGKLFREVIFPESELVGSNRKYELIVKWAQRSAYAGLALAAIGLLGIWAGSISQHDTYMSEVDSYVTEFKLENKRLSAWNKDIRAVVPSLNALAKASIVYDQEEHPWLSGFGLYDANVDNSADAAYSAQLKEIFLPRVVEYLEQRILKGHKGGDLYHSFRIYLMFNKLEQMDKQLITDWFVTDWANNMQGEASYRQALEKHLQALLNLELEPYQLNSQLVTQTRKLLLRVPVHQRIYSRIRTNPEFNQKVELLNLFGETVREAYAITPAVEAALTMPFMFTKDGYDSIDLSTESPVIADIVNERWVLSDDESSKVDFVEEDLEDISKKVNELYMADYIKQWTKALAALNIAEFKNLSQANELLTRFVDPVYSPLLAILQVGIGHTQLSPPIFASLEDDQGEGKKGEVAALLASKIESTKVDKKFKSFNGLLRETSKRPAPIAAIMQKIQQLNDFIGEISVSPDPGKKAFELAKTRYQSGGSNAITALRTYAKKTPDPVDRWLKGIADQSWKVILSSARQYVNVEWKIRVYGAYSRSLAGRYPLKRTSDDEIALLDFVEFFKPRGTIDLFYGEFIKPFVKTGKTWKNNTIDRRSLNFNSAALKQLKRAQSITTIFFRKNPAVPTISFQLKPDKMEKKDAQFWLDLGGQRINYKHGPKFWKNLDWSGEDENKRVRIIFEDLDENRHEASYDGPWAWFRLQDASKLEKTNKANVFLVNYSVAEQADGKKTDVIHTIQFLIKARSVDSPFGQNLLGAFRCPESL